MTMMSIHDGAPRRQPPGIAKALLRWWAQARERRKIRTEMKELSCLSPRLLPDMGPKQYAAPREPTIPMPWH